jgi:hypothetical protein
MINKKKVMPFNVLTTITGLTTLFLYQILDCADYSVIRCTDIVNTNNLHITVNN